MRVWPGKPFPLGPSWDGQGTNFSIFSENAARVELCLYDEQDAEKRLLGPRPLQEQSELVDQHGHQDDVEQIAPVEVVGRELREQR